MVDEILQAVNTCFLTGLLVTVGVFGSLEFLITAVHSSIWELLNKT